ncbi:hypothetical protein E2C01_026160 [Portunus trituberculatus]|uniref:Uncharacterized protein n=1 Tax=Portunus trituberculatus TaxID=210409 RepID=A0A5B7EHW5_PORTR|nr:hypothetical protein [Portunus trituberculatus]
MFYRVRASESASLCRFVAYMSGPEYGFISIANVVGRSVYQVPWSPRMGGGSSSLSLYPPSLHSAPNGMTMATSSQS